jgi:hypothetical protein
VRHFVVLWPLLVVVAVLLIRTQQPTAAGHGWRWLLAWVGAGFLWSFSLLTGFSIGLLLLPVAAALLLWVARRSPHVREAVGFVGGLGVTAAVVVLIQA